MDGAPKGAGGRGRLARLIELHGPLVHGVAWRLLGDRHEALDVLQEACLRLHERLDTVSDEHARAWLVRVARNRALDLLRRRRRWWVGSAAVAGEPSVADDERPDRRAQASERTARLLAALARLPRRQREVVTLRIFDDLTFAQIALQLGVSQGTAKVHFRRGLVGLRGVLGVVVAPDTVS